MSDIIPEIGCFIYYDDARLPVLVIDTNIGSSSFTGVVYDTGKGEPRESLPFDKITRLLSETETIRFVRRWKPNFQINEFAVMAGVRREIARRSGCY
jgi:hypothetical protein